MMVTLTLLRLNSRCVTANIHIPMDNIELNSSANNLTKLDIHLCLTISKCRKASAEIVLSLYVVIYVNNMILTN